MKYNYEISEDIRYFCAWQQRKALEYKSKKIKEGASWTYDTPSLDNEYQEEYYIKML